MEIPRIIPILLLLFVGLCSAHLAAPSTPAGRRGLLIKPTPSKTAHGRDATGNTAPVIPKAVRAANDFESSESDSGAPKYASKAKSGSASLPPRAPAHHVDDVEVIDDAANNGLGAGAVGKGAAGKGAAGKRAAGKDATGKGAANNGMVAGNGAAGKGGGTSGKGATGKGAAGKGAAGKGAAGKGAAGKGAAGKGAAGKGAAGKGAAGKGAAGKGVAGKGAAGKGAANKGAANKGAANKGAANKGAAGKGAANKGAAGKGAGKGAVNKVALKHVKGAPNNVAAKGAAGYPAPNKHLNKPNVAFHKENAQPASGAATARHINNNQPAAMMGASKLSKPRMATADDVAIVHQGSATATATAAPMGAEERATPMRAEEGAARPHMATAEDVAITHPGSAKATAAAARMGAEEDEGWRNVLADDDDENDDEKDNENDDNGNDDKDDDNERDNQRDDERDNQRDDERVNNRDNERGDDRDNKRDDERENERDNERDDERDNERDDEGDDDDENDDENDAVNWHGRESSSTGRNGRSMGQGRGGTHGDVKGASSRLAHFAIDRAWEPRNNQHTGLHKAQQFHMATSSDVAIHRSGTQGSTVKEAPSRVSRFSNNNGRELGDNQRTGFRRAQQLRMATATDVAINRSGTHGANRGVNRASGLDKAPEFRMATARDVAIHRSGMHGANRGVKRASGLDKAQQFHMATATDVAIHRSRAHGANHDGDYNSGDYNGGDYNGGDYNAATMVTMVITMGATGPATMAEIMECRPEGCAEGRMCGHDTQVVWGGMILVRCAKAQCPDGGGMWVCDYSPRGNIIGSTPF
ncbi:unnamed protein product [Closterium sp. Yama58-4]|nr:unnamed protein product [Closterium sp. Yama58-4]